MLKNLWTTTYILEHNAWVTQKSILIWIPLVLAVMLILLILLILQLQNLFLTFLVFVTAPLRVIGTAFALQLFRAPFGEERRTAVAAADKSCRLAATLYQRGAGNYLSILDARRAKLVNDDEHATSVRVALVSLYRAFGGGWSSELSLTTTIVNQP